MMGSWMGNYVGLMMLWIVIAITTKVQFVIKVAKCFKRRVGLYLNIPMSQYDDIYKENEKWLWEDYLEKAKQKTQPSVYRTNIESSINK